MRKYLIPIILGAIGAVMILLHFVLHSAGTSSLDVKIQPTSYIMPAAYKVYSNEEALNGRFYLCKLLITNGSNSMMDHVDVSYEIPGYIQSTSVEKFKYLTPGQSVVVTIYPKFDPSVAEKSSTSKEKANIKIAYQVNNKSDEFEKSFGFEMRGRNDLVYSSLSSEEILSYPDMFENLSLVPCFVTPEDPVIKYYTQMIQDKVLKGEAASVNQTNEEAVRFLMGIYQATLQAGMVYSGTKGIPIKLGDVNSLIQHIRLPREVVTGNTGLCIELSCLYASVLSCAGLEPYIFFIPGHAFPGVSVNNTFFAMEATGIGGEGLGSIASAEDALKKGMEELQDFFTHVQEGDPRYMVANVHDLYAKGVHPMELKDDNFLKQKVDEIAMTITGGKQFNTQQAQGVQNTQYASTGKENTRARNTRNNDENDDNNYDNSNNNGMAAYSGAVKFNYPNGWTRYNNPVAGIPPLITQLESPDQSAFIAVYRIQGTNDTDDAMDYLSQLYGNLGYNVQYQNAGNYGNFIRYSGKTYSNAGNSAWGGFFRSSGNNVVGVILGSPPNYYNQMMGMFNQIVSTLH
jgi:hypothetical protein